VQRVDARSTTYSVRCCVLVVKPRRVNTDFVVVVVVVVVTTTTTTTTTVVRHCLDTIRSPARCEHVDLHSSLFTQLGCNRCPT
jgi:hypothetical protein